MSFVIGFTILFLIVILSALSVFIAIIIYLILQSLHQRWKGLTSKQWIRRISIVLAGLLVVTSPYLLFKAYELHLILARVPNPLHVAWIEYRLEDSFGGVGLPGDNETGFVVYRLTRKSTQWARNKGPHLGEALPGGIRNWHPTPINDNESQSRWHHYDRDRAKHDHPVTIAEYLDAYGFPIPIEKGRDDDANRAIRERGSFYSYGRGGTVTIVDPARGKVYFAYAG